jgi:hypothetical protein
MKIKTFICIDCGMEYTKSGRYQKRCSKCKENYEKERGRQKYLDKIKEFEKRGLNFNKENYKKNRKTIRKRQRKYHLKNNTHLRNLAFKTLAGNKIECIKHHEWKCCVNPKDLDILQIDHINNDGSDDRKNFNGLTWYRWIINNPKKARNKLQIICANAQWKKRRMVENKYRKGFDI